MSSRTMERTKVPGIYRFTRPDGGSGYKVVVSVGMDSVRGGYRQKSKTVRTFAEAKQAKASIEAQVASGAFVHDRREVTVRGYLTDWLAGKAHSVKPSTAAAYAHHAKPVIALLGDRPMQKVTKADLDRMVTALLVEPTKARPEGRSPRTVNHVLVMVKQVFADAVAEGLLPRSPAATVKRVRDHRDSGDRRRQFDTWTKEQMQVFAAHVVDDRLLGVWTLLGLGLRLGEAVGMRWEEDVDLDSPVVVNEQGQQISGPSITIRRTRTKVDTQTIEGTPKSMRSRRTLYLGPVAVARLRTAKAMMAAERLAAGEAWAGGLYVASDEIGRPIKPDVVQRSFYRHAEAAGLPRIRVHDLRHTSITLMLKAGVPVHVVAAWHGHDPMLTLTTYADAKLDTETGAVADAAFG